MTQRKLAHATEPTNRTCPHRLAFPTPNWRRDHIVAQLHQNSSRGAMNGQDPHPGELTSALARAEVISRPPILNLSADRSRSRSTSIYDSPSTAHLTGLQAPAMRSVHASLDHIATAVVSV